MNGRLYEIERRLTETDGRRDAPTSEL
jgi:hypothetical protein